MRTFHRIRKNSIIVRVVLFMTLVVLLQALFVAAMIHRLNVPDTLERNTYTLFAEKIQNRRNYMLSEMLSRWSNIGDFQDQIISHYDQTIAGRSSLTDEEQDHFLSLATPTLLRMLQTSRATGSFLILGDKVVESGSNTGLYIQSYNPQQTDQSAMFSSLTMLRGPSAISKEHLLPLSNSWSYGFALDEAHRPIFEQPLAAAALTNVSHYQGYWHVSPSLSSPNTRILSFSLPLRDSAGALFGVIGVEISQDYLYGLLPNDDFADNGSFGYLLVQRDLESGALIPRISQGTAQRSIATLDTPMNLLSDDTAENQFYIYSPLGQISAHYERLNPYSPNTPFADTEWYLLGLTANENITHFADLLRSGTFWMTLWSVVFGSLAAFLIAYYFARPIMRLSESVRTSHFDGALNLGQTGIDEIDKLSAAIEQLGSSIYDSTLKTEQIMAMTNIGVGSFEHKNGDERVMVSTSLQGMLDLRPLHEGGFYVAAPLFFTRLAELKCKPEPELFATYLVSENPKRWFKFTEVQNNDGLLGVVIDVTKDVLERHALNYERDYDTLTGIYNRLAFHRRAKTLFAGQDLKVAAAAMFDLDNLKYVNDTHGHETGDLYIKTAARIMEQTLNHNAVVGRISGDEFYVFFYGFDSRKDIHEYLRRLYRNLDQEPIILPSGARFKVRMSGGISWYGHDSRDYHELLRFADFAMYEGKHTVKGELREFKRDVYLAESFMLSGKEELNRVLDNELVDYVFQPIIAAKTGKLYAYEALMRPQSELLNTPDKLIQIATAQSQLWKIEKITFFKTLAAYDKYRDLFGSAKLFLNSVPNQMLKEAEFAEIEQLYGDFLSDIVVEIIENERLDAGLFQTKLSRISSWGAQVALDDYGTGYNNDISLLSIHPHIVKLDRFLISNVESDPSHQAIVAKILGFCRESGIAVLAEGVETAEQMHYLIAQGVDFLQGYYISLPLPLPTFDDSNLRAQLGNLGAAGATEAKPHLDT